MPRWEVCEIVFARFEGLEAWDIDVYAPEDEDETSNNVPDDDERHFIGDKGLRALVAHLGREGWEPMPIVEVSGYQGSMIRILCQGGGEGAGRASRASVSQSQPQRRLTRSGSAARPAR